MKEGDFMEPVRHGLPGAQQNNDIALIKTQKLPQFGAAPITGTLERETITTPAPAKTTSRFEEVLDALADTDKRQLAAKSEPIEKVNTIKTASISKQASAEAVSREQDDSLAVITTRKLPTLPAFFDVPTTPIPISPRMSIKRGHALLLVSLLCILVIRSINIGAMQFIGSQGWAYVLNGPSGGDDLLQTIDRQLHSRTLAPRLTPQQYINLIMQNMTLDQKIGQMMIVQFVGPTYSLDLSTMISQYNVGAALIYAANDNIIGKNQLRGLIQQMQSHSLLPLTIAIDQEGGTVDRLKSLDGPRPSATEIGTTDDPRKAFDAGIQDAKDLSYYGINLNLAPVVDVANAFNPQLYLRTYGDNATIVTRMAAAYLQGLQQSGKVLGTLKHFPGLGDVSADPHYSVPYLSRSKSDLEAIDWAPYRSLIQQGNVYAVMVTHEIVPAIDDSKPSSLSKKIVTGILRDDLGFQGVVMTDSLTMEGITAYYSPAQAAALAIEAGADVLMGASTPSGVATMIEGIKQDINAGNISMQRIDDSVRRILMLKYQMGLIHIPTN
jgi:beta-N-acetylhexosaminidase